MSWQAEIPPLDHADPDGQVAFRAAVREWIETNAPRALSHIADWSRLILGTNYWWAYEEERKHPDFAVWERRLLAARLICAGWPEQFGGRGMTAIESAIVDDEFLRANLPRISREQGEAFVGPAVMAHGTAEQIGRLLPPILEGRSRYSQAFSEPDHGSDLAGIVTKGEIDGGVLKVSGQKSWVSGAAHATSLFLLCRTDPTEAAHRGISYVVVDLSRNRDRVEIRPVRQMNGSADFCDVFLDAAEVPLEDVIGGLHGGWKVAMTTLGVERARAVARHSVYAEQVRALLDDARKWGVAGHAVARDRLAGAYSRLSVLRWTGLRALERLAAGAEGDVAGSLDKLAASEFQRGLGELATDLAGIHATVADDETRRWQRLFLDTRSLTIVAGTSEIQRNLIAERQLGLPREPRPERSTR